MNQDSAINYLAVAKKLIDLIEKRKPTLADSDSIKYEIISAV